MVSQKGEQKKKKTLKVFLKELFQKYSQHGLKFWVFLIFNLEVLKLTSVPLAILYIKSSLLLTINYSHKVEVKLR